MLAHPQFPALDMRLTPGAVENLVTLFTGTTGRPANSAAWWTA